MTDYDNYFDVLKDLNRIVENEYNEADSERNHQTFAAALRMILKEVGKDAMLRGLLNHKPALKK